MRIWETWKSWIGFDRYPRSFVFLYLWLQMKIHPVTSSITLGSRSRKTERGTYLRFGFIKGIWYFRSFYNAIMFWASMHIIGLCNHWICYWVKTNDITQQPAPTYLILYKVFVITTITIFINITTIIINTRPKPAYGRQDLAGSWGQDTDQAGTFWVVLNDSLRAECKPIWNYKKP